ncbi:hypothetical protein GKN94_11350 [Candidatus Lucifugimonas marina]|uniref:restriction endonuclease n=1 Tax=Candidatus Lucifugimonas marina TaxID=3038979 RepID=UPI0027A05E0C|nr:hypothetical protein GKN94_11350 [SAR202 cluster bacterium JH545]
MMNAAKPNRLYVGEVLHLGKGDPLGCRNFREVTSGTHSTAIDINKGIFFFREVGTGGNKRRPAGVFYSNNLAGLSGTNPWPDLIESDRGRAVYHGDNKSVGKPALEAPGNKLLWQLLPLYSDPTHRQNAPPILMFEQVTHGGHRKGFRRFAGYGVPTGVRLQSQAASGGSFSNLSIEIALFAVDQETDAFDWAWIDDRRTADVPAELVNQKAPDAWKQWVTHGASAVESVRRVVYSRMIMSKEDQQPANSEGKSLLKEVHAHYSADPHGFEAIASLVTSKTMDPHHSRGWVTRRSGDGGVDFVSRVEIGSGFASTDVVVLGQAKNLNPTTGSVSGRDLARLVSRLRRGWLGAFVTTGVFTPNAQREVVADEYPLVLSHGRDVATVLQQELIATGISLEQLFEREYSWYAANQRDLPPEQILNGADLGTSIWPNSPS